MSPVSKPELKSIPLGGWRTQAACTDRVYDKLWDDQVEHETEDQRRDRHTKAKTICRSCPVRPECSDEADWMTDEGIRGGHKLPSLHPVRSRNDQEMLRLLKEGLTLDDAAKIVSGTR